MLDYIIEDVATYLASSFFFRKLDAPFIYIEIKQTSLTLT